MRERIAEVGSADLVASLSLVQGRVAGLLVDVTGKLTDLLAARDWRDNLRRPPWQRHVAVVVKEVLHLVAHQRDRLEIAVIATAEVALDKANRRTAEPPVTTCPRRHRFATSPLSRK